MSHIVKLSAKARRDVEGVLAWTFDQFGLNQHDAYRELIELALERIGRDPFGPAAKDRSDLKAGVWTQHIEQRGRPARHLFAYRMERSGKIRVLRFLYDGMDLGRHL